MIRIATENFLAALRAHALECNRPLPVTDFDLLQLIADGVALLTDCDEDELNDAAATLAIEFAALAEDFSD